MKYRAILTGVAGLERPVQLLGNSLVAAQEWARVTVNKYDVDTYPEARVTITKFVEEVVEVVVPEAIA
jgi:hypothetical protein